MLRLAALALLALPCFAQLPDAVREPHRTVVEAAKESKIWSAKKYDALIARFDAPLDADAARALFRDMVQFAYDHDNGDDYLRMLVHDLERPDMKDIGWGALPDEIEVEKVTLHDGRVLLGTGGLLASRHPELDPKALAGQRFINPTIGFPGIGNFWIAKEEVKKSERARVKRPQVLLAGEPEVEVGEDGSLRVTAEWVRPGRGKKRETIALKLVDLGNGGTVFANPDEGLFTIWRTAELEGLAKLKATPAAVIEEMGWGDAKAGDDGNGPDVDVHRRLRDLAPGVEWPEPFDADPAVKVAVRDAIEKGVVKVDESDAEASLLRLRFLYTYGAHPPALALSDPAAFRRLEDAVRAFLRGGPIEPVLKTGADAATVAAVVRHAPDFEPAPEPGVTKDGVWLKFPKWYGPWKRRPLLVALHGQYHEPEYDFGIWTRLAGTRDWIVAAPTYGSTDGTTRSAASDDVILKAVRQLCLERNVDPDRVYLTGISMGGAMTWRLAQSYPSRWAAVGPEIHGPREINGKFLQLCNLHATPIFLMEGEFDGLNTINSRNAVAALGELKAPVEAHEGRNTGHDRMPWLYPGFLRWAAERRRDAHPSRIEHWALNAYEGSSAWLSIRRASHAAAFGAKDGAFNAADLCGVEATYRGGTISLEVLGGKPAEVEVFLDDRVMTAAEIRIEGGAKPVTWKPKPDVRKLLERVRETGEREAVYADSVKVEMK